MTKLRFYLLCLLCAAFPSAAHAQGGWWDTIEEWSGPGPFQNGGVVDVRIGCIPSAKGQADAKAAALAAGKKEPPPWVWLSGERNKKYPCLTKDRDAINAYLDVRYVRATTAENTPLFSDRPNELTGTVTANAFQVLVMHEVVPAVAVGAGVGMMWFSGSTLNQSVHPFTLTPISVTITPLRFLLSDSGWQGRLSRLINFNFEEIAAVGTFDAHSFNTTSTSSFSARTELRRSYSIVVDVLAALKD